jgi:hypothetical protein
MEMHPVCIKSEIGGPYKRYAEARWVPLNATARAAHAFDRFPAA